MYSVACNHLFDLLINHMKKMFLLFGLLIYASFSAFSQNANNTKAKYCIVRSSFFLNNKNIKAFIDSAGKEAEIKEASGETKHFRSNTELLNFIATQGWVLVSSYRDGDIYFIFKKSME
jgi:hypothetical protein